MFRQVLHLPFGQQILVKYHITIIAQVDVYIASDSKQVYAMVIV